MVVRRLVGSTRQGVHGANGTSAGNPLVSYEYSVEILWCYEHTAVFYHCARSIARLLYLVCSPRVFRKYLPSVYLPTKEQTPSFFEILAPGSSRPSARGSVDISVPAPFSHDRDALEKASRKVKC